MAVNPALIAASRLAQAQRGAAAQGQPRRGVQIGPVSAQRVRQQQIAQSGGIDWQALTDEAHAAQGKPAGGGSGGGIFGAVFNNPVTRAVTAPLNLLDVPRRTVISGIKELGDIASGEGASLKDFVSQAKDPSFGYGSIVGDLTPWSWVNRGIGLTGDILLDPMTYLTLGASKIPGASGRIALAQAAEKAGLGEEVIRRAGRYGGNAITDAAERQAIIEAGGALRPKIGMEFAGMQIPKTEKLTTALQSVINKAREPLIDTRFAQGVRKYGSSAARTLRTRPSAEILATGKGDVGEAARYITMVQAQKGERGLAEATFIPEVRRLGDEFGDNAEITHAMEAGVDTPETRQWQRFEDAGFGYQVGEKGARDQGLDDVADLAAELGFQGKGVSVGYRPNRVRHVPTAEGKEILDKTPGLGAATELLPTESQFSRKIVPGGGKGGVYTIGGHEFTPVTGTIQEINEWAASVGLPKLYEDSPRVLLARSAEDVAHAVGNARFLAEARRGGPYQVAGEDFFQMLENEAKSEAAGKARAGTFTEKLKAGRLKVRQGRAKHESFMSQIRAAETSRLQKEVSSAKGLSAKAQSELNKSIANVAEKESPEAMRAALQEEWAPKIAALEEDVAKAQAKHAEAQQKLRDFELGTEKKEGARSKQRRGYAKAKKLYDDSLEDYNNAAKALSDLRSVTGKLTAEQRRLPGMEAKLAAAEEAMARVVPMTSEEAIESIREPARQAVREGAVPPEPRVLNEMEGVRHEDAQRTIDTLQKEITGLEEKQARASAAGHDFDPDVIDDLKRRQKDLKGIRERIADEEGIDLASLQPGDRVNVSTGVVTEDFATVIDVVNGEPHIGVRITGGPKKGKLKRAPYRPYYNDYLAELRHREQALVREINEAMNSVVPLAEQIQQRSTRIEGLKGVQQNLGREQLSTTQRIQRDIDKVRGKIEEIAARGDQLTPAQTRRLDEIKEELGHLTRTTKSYDEEIYQAQRKVDEAKANMFPEAAEQRQNLAEYRRAQDIAQERYDNATTKAEERAARQEYFDAKRAGDQIEAEWEKLTKTRLKDLDAAQKEQLRDLQDNVTYLKNMRKQSERLTRSQKQTRISALRAEQAKLERTSAEQIADWQTKLDALLEKQKRRDPEQAQLEKGLPRWRREAEAVKGEKPPELTGQEFLENAQQELSQARSREALHFATPGEREALDKLRDRRAELRSDLGIEEGAAPTPAVPAPEAAAPAPTRVATATPDELAQADRYVEQTKQRIANNEAEIDQLRATGGEQWRIDGLEKTNAKLREDLPTLRERFLGGPRPEAVQESPALAEARRKLAYAEENDASEIIQEHFRKEVARLEQEAPTPAAAPVPEAAPAPAAAAPEGLPPAMEADLNARLEAEDANYAKLLDEIDKRPKTPAKDPAVVRDDAIIKGYREQADFFDSEAERIEAQLTTLSPKQRRQLERYEEQVRKMEERLERARTPAARENLRQRIQTVLDKYEEVSKDSKAQYAARLRREAERQRGFADDIEKALPGARKRRPTKARQKADLLKRHETRKATMRETANRIAASKREELAGIEARIAQTEGRIPREVLETIEQRRGVVGAEEARLAGTPQAEMIAAAGEDPRIQQQLKQRQAAHKQRVKTITERPGKAEARLAELAGEAEAGIGPPNPRMAAAMERIEKIPISQRQIEARQAEHLAAQAPEGLEELRAAVPASKQRIEELTAEKERLAGESAEWAPWRQYKPEEIRADYLAQREKVRAPLQEQRNKLQGVVRDKADKVITMTDNLAAANVEMQGAYDAVLPGFQQAQQAIYDAELGKSTWESATAVAEARLERVKALEPKSKIGAAPARPLPGGAYGPPIPKLTHEDLRHTTEEFRQTLSTTIDVNTGQLVPKDLSQETMDLLTAAERVANEVQVDEANNALMAGWQEAFATGKLTPVIEKVAQDGFELYRTNAMVGRDLYISKYILAQERNFRNATSTAVKRSSFGKQIDKYTRFFKNWATATPGFHIRNAISATVMNASEGVPFRTMSDGAIIWNEFMKNPLSDWKARLPERLQEHADQTIQAVFATGAGGRFSAEELAHRAYGTPGSASRWEKLYSNWWTKGSQRFGEKVEGGVRAGLALHSFREGDNLQAAVTRIKRIHFDYGDVNELDEVLRPYVPFWTFMSRNLPLQVQQMWLKPSTYLKYQSIKRNFGQEEGDLMPDYLKRMGAFRITGGLALAPDIGSSQIQSQIASLQDPKLLLTNLNPLFKVPMEVATSRDLFYNRPYRANDFQQVAPETTPIAALMRIIGGDKLVPNTPGGLAIERKYQNAIYDLLPFLAQTNRLGQTTENRAGKGWQYWLNWLGVPVKQLDPNAAREEIEFQRRQSGRQSPEEARQEALRRFAAGRAA